MEDSPPKETSKYERESSQSVAVEDNIQPFDSINEANNNLQQSQYLSPFSQTNAPTYRRVSSQDVSTSLEGLRLLARQGSWRAIVEKVKAARKGLSLEHHLAFQAYHILSLIKLRMYGAAADELRALGSLESPQYRYESHPQLFLDKTGSMVPFALRWLHAELPHRMGQTGTTIERLYSLLAYCNKQIDLLSGGTSDVSRFVKETGYTSSVGDGNRGTSQFSIGKLSSPIDKSSIHAKAQESLVPPTHSSAVPPISVIPPPSPPPQTGSDSIREVSSGTGLSNESSQPLGRSPHSSTSAADILEGLLSGTSIGSPFSTDDRGGLLSSSRDREEGRHNVRGTDDDAFSDISGAGTPHDESFLSSSTQEGFRVGADFEGVFELGELSPAQESENSNSKIDPFSIRQGSEVNSEARNSPRNSDVECKNLEGSMDAAVRIKDQGGEKIEHRESDKKVVGLAERWKRRHESVLHALISHHMAQRDFQVVLQWLEWLARRRPEDFRVLAKYGYVQLQMGDLQDAQATCARVEALANGITDQRTQAFLHRNRGLVFFALKRYPQALVEFDQALTEDHTDHVAANNKALCLMYSRDLMGAVKVLEDVLQKSPLTALHETLVLNLCSMYELASSNCTTTKRTLSNWLARLAPDDFDLMCTRL